MLCLDTSSVVKRSNVLDSTMATWLGLGLGLELGVSVGQHDGHLVSRV